MNISRVGVDIAKRVFQVHGVDRHGTVRWQATLKREQWIEHLCSRVEPGAEIGMEACAGAHHWARLLQSRGYRVKLMAGQFVKPYVKSNKTDRADAEAICEAMSRPSMRFVSIKTLAQQDVQAIHRVRQELVGQRTAKANQVRGLVGEYGLVAPTRIAALRRAIPDWLEDADNGLSFGFRELLAGLWQDLQRLDERVEELDALNARELSTHPDAKRVMALRGVGPLIASALLGRLGDGREFARGRDFAVSLGLTPKQHSSGGRERLQGISKRGDPYLRTLLVHGARTVLQHAKGKDDPLSRWVNKMLERRPYNVVVVALASKTARIAWALVCRGVDYDAKQAAAM